MTITQFAQVALCDNETTDHYDEILFVEIDLYGDLKIEADHRICDLEEVIRQAKAGGQVEVLLTKTLYNSDINDSDDVPSYDHEQYSDGTVFVLFNANV